VVGFFAADVGFPPVVAVAGEGVEEFVGVLVGVLRPEGVFGVEADGDAVVGGVIEEGDGCFGVVEDVEAADVEAGVGAVFPEFVGGGVEDGEDVGFRGVSEVAGDLEVEGARVFAFVRGFPAPDEEGRGGGAGEGEKAAAMDHAWWGPERGIPKGRGRCFIFADRCGGRVRRDAEKTKSVSGLADVWN